jgi:hypothetical protein
VIVNKLQHAIDELLVWLRQPDAIELPASALGLYDIVTTGLADFGIWLPKPVQSLDGSWLQLFFLAAQKARHLNELEGQSARTRSMVHIAREHCTYHVTAIVDAAGGLKNIKVTWQGAQTQALRVSFCELISHLALGFATQGRVPHCGAAGRALLVGAIDFDGDHHFVPPAPAFRYMGDETAIVNLHFGSPMFVDLNDDSVCPEVIQTGWWEPWIDGVLQKTIGRGDIAVNVGANLGYHVLRIAHCVQDAGKIVAYEPNPRLLKRLARSVKWAGLSAITTIMPFAVSRH